MGLQRVKMEAQRAVEMLLRCMRSVDFRCFSRWVMWWVRGYGWYMVFYWVMVAVVLYNCGTMSCRTWLTGSDVLERQLAWNRDLVSEKLKRGDRVKVAVVVTGLPRSLDQVLGNQGWGLSHLNPSTLFEIDVFFALTVGKDVQTRKTFERSEVLHVDKWKTTLGKYGLHLAHADAYPDDPFPDDMELRFIAVNSRSTTKSVAYQFQSLHRSYEVMERHEREHNINYDLVLRLRTDCVFLTPLNIRQILSDTKPSGRPRVFVAKYGHYGGINDRYGMMDRAAAKSYLANRYLYWMRSRPIPPMNEFFFTNLPNAEAYLRASLEYDRITIHKTEHLQIQLAPHGCFSYYNECGHAIAQVFEEACKMLGCNVVPHDTLNAEMLERLECIYQKYAENPELSCPKLI